MRDSKSKRIIRGSVGLGSRTCSSEIAGPAHQTQFQQHLQGVAASPVLNNSAVPDSLNVDRPQRNLLPRGWQAREGTEMRGPRDVPSRDDVALGHLPLNGRDQIRVAAAEGEEMLRHFEELSPPETNIPLKSRGVIPDTGPEPPP